MSFKVNLKDVALLKNGKKITKKESGKYEVFGANGQIGYSDEFLLEKESIVLGRVGANCGSVHYSSKPIWISDNTIGVVPKDNVDGYYLYYILSSLRLNEMAAGSAQPLINQSIINSIDLNLINLDAQKKVGAFLRYIDEKIKTNKEIISTLEQISQTIFKQWFIDFEFPNEEGQPYKSNDGEMVESELGEIPENWNVSSISELCAINKGSYSKKDDWSFINYLDTSNITKNSINSIQLIDTKNEKVPSRAKRKLEKNDILYSTVRPNQYHFGLIKEPIENMLASTGFTVIRSKGSYPNDLIYMWIAQDEITSHLQSIAEQSTSAYPSIKADDLGDLKILVPQKEVIDQLNNIISKNHNLIWNYQKENKKLSQLRDTLLPKLLSGEIEISDDLEV